MEKWNETFDLDLLKLKTLPDELFMLIFSYLPISCKVFLNNYFYKKYHYFIKKIICKHNFENYIRDIIRRDNDFVFFQILNDYQKEIYKLKNFVYKNVMYKNYYYFLTDYCIKNDSSKCRIILNNFFKEQGLCKNRHKKNTFIHIRWKY